MSIGEKSPLHSSSRFREGRFSEIAKSHQTEKSFPTTVFQVAHPTIVAGRKPDEGVEEMPNTIFVGEHCVAQTNTAASMVGNYLSTVR